MQKSVMITLKKDFIPIGNIIGVLPADPETG